VGDKTKLTVPVGALVVFKVVEFALPRKLASLPYVAVKV
jgi:hypothetical protein